MKRALLSLAAFLICVVPLCGCDPVLPESNISAVLSPSDVTVGEEITVTIVYPDTADTAVARWSNQTLTILEGDAEITGDMKFKALSPGEILLSVGAVAECDFNGATLDHVKYSVELTVTAHDGAPKPGELFSVGMEATPIFVNAPQSSNKNALLLIGAVGKDGYVGVSELGFDERAFENDDKRLTPETDEDGALTGRYFINCDLVSPGDTVTLYSENGKATATVALTYVYFQEDTYPFFELTTDAALDENKVYFASTRGDLDISVFALGADSVDIDLDGDGKNEKIASGVTNELLENFEELNDVGEDELYYFGTQWVKAENGKTAVQANGLITGYGEHVRVSILGACDFDGDGAKEFVTRFEGLYDRFTFWNFGGDSLDPVIECG